MKQRLIIPGRLPGRNEAENKARAHWSKGARLKKDCTNLVAWECRKQRLKPIKGKANIAITFWEPNARRDLDNVTGGSKYILDGLVCAGVLCDDSRRFIDELRMSVKLDRNKPRIEVDIEEAGA